MNNFEFEHNDKKYWYSRSVAVVGIIFLVSLEEGIHVLANKRGKGTPDYQGYWNMPCGYLDFNETCEQAIIREIFEETGLSIKPDLINLIGIDSIPEGSQTVTLRYSGVILGKTDEYKLSNKYSEENEVEEAKWIHEDNLYKYHWAFGHDNIIRTVKKEVNCFKYKKRWGIQK